MVARMAGVRAFVLALLSVVSLNSAAAPFAVRLGEERVVLDAPPGFADTLDLASPRLRELAESLTSASNRILLFALTDGDLRSFTTGDSPDLLRYLLIATPRAHERESLSLGQFSSYSAGLLRAFGDAADPAELTALLDARPVGQPSVLRELRRTPLLVTMLLATRLPPRTPREPQYMLYTHTLMLLRGKVLAVSVYARYRGPADTAWLIESTQRWIDELQQLNGR